MKYACVYLLITFFWSLNLSSLPIDTENLNLSEPESQGMKKSNGSELDAIITKALNDEKIQGAVVAVSRFGNPIYFSAHGFSDVPNKVAMRKLSLIHI